MVGKQKEADDHAAGAIEASKGTKRPRHEHKMATESGAAASRKLFHGDGQRILANVAALHRRPEYREADRILIATEGKFVDTAMTHRLAAMDLVCKALHRPNEVNIFLQVT